MEDDCEFENVVFKAFILENRCVPIFLLRLKGKGRGNYFPFIRIVVKYLLRYFISENVNHLYYRMNCRIIYLLIIRHNVEIHSILLSSRINDSFHFFTTA